MMRTMPAIVNYSSAPRSVELREVPVPQLSTTDVLIAVQAVGVCGSDLHQYEGTASWMVNHPVVLGHEFAGVVAGVGRSVDHYTEGDRVVSETAAVVNPHSAFTQTGRYNLDPDRLGFGYGVDGGMAAYVAVPARLLHRIPANVDFSVAALTEPACVAYQATQINATVRPGDAVLVLGPGPIGLLCAHLASLAGAIPLGVAGIAPDAHRLQLARQFGATHTVDITAESARDTLLDLTDGYGFDLVVDAAGVSPALASALDLVRPGGHIVKVGWGPQSFGHTLDPLIAKAVTLQGSFSHTWATWERVLHLLANDRLNLTATIGGQHTFEDWETAFTRMRDGLAVKSVLIPPAPEF